MKTKLLCAAWLFSFPSFAQETDSLRDQRLHQMLQDFIAYCDHTSAKMLRLDQLDSVHFYAGLLENESDAMMEEIRKVIPQKECASTGIDYQTIGLLFSVSDDPAVAALGTVYQTLDNSMYTVCEEDPAFVKRLRDINDFAGQLGRVRKLERAWRKTTRMMLECRNMRHVLPAAKIE